MKLKLKIENFNFNQVRSNIHVLRAFVTPKDETTWNFPSRINDFVKLTDCPELFVRCQLPSEKSDLGILFELSMHCIKRVSKNARSLSLV